MPAGHSEKEMKVQDSSSALGTWGMAALYSMTLCACGPALSRDPCSGRLIALNHGGTHRPGDTQLETVPLVTAPDIPASMSPPRRWVGTESVASQGDS